MLGPIMPRTVAAKVVMWIYGAGYWAFVLTAAVTAWPHLPLMTWWTYVLFQAMYGIAWPVLLALNLQGVHWS